MSEEVPIKLIPGIEIEYEKEYKYEKGYLSISLKNGSWNINYEFKTFRYFLGSSFRGLRVNLDITDEAQRTIWAEDEKTGKSYEKEIVDWLIRDYGTDFKVVTHKKEEIEEAEELQEPKLTKSYREVTLEYYEKNKILRIPFYKDENKNDEIRINIENENLEYIRNNEKIIKIFPLNKEAHFYGIKPKIMRYIVTREGTELVSIE